MHFRPHFRSAFLFCLQFHSAASTIILRWFLLLENRNCTAPVSPIILFMVSSARPFCKQLFFHIFVSSFPRQIKKKDGKLYTARYLCADSFSLSFSSVIAWSFCSRFFLFLFRRHRAVIRSSLVVSILLCKNKRPFNALLLCQWHTQCTNQKKSVGDTRREEAVSNLLLCNASDGQITAASVVFTVHVFRHWTCSDTILLFRLA